MTTIYHYHPVTREYVGQGVADPSPLEPGTWLMPASSTGIAPPVTSEREVAVFAEDHWTAVPDWRDVPLYSTANGAEVRITELGVVPADIDATTEPPPSPRRTHAQLADAKRTARDAALNATDWLISRHQDEKLIGDATTLTSDQFAALLTYRQALRDLSDAPEWPAVDLPTAPAFITAIA